MQERSWKATWRDQAGHPQEYTFHAPNNRILAEIDFQYTLIEQGKPVPEQFELEEGRQIVRVVPHISELRRRL